MKRITSDILIIGGGPAGMAAARASTGAGLSVSVVDDNPNFGGQIWRAELGKIGSSAAQKTLAKMSDGDIQSFPGTQVFAGDVNGRIYAETTEKTLEMAYRKLIIATGARERFLPFPGWTLPNVTGAGGLQALVKGGYPIKGKRVVLAGTGPLLIAVADYLRRKKAKVLLIAEQTGMVNVIKFLAGLSANPDKLADAVRLKIKTLGIPYKTGCHVVSVSRKEGSLSVKLLQNGKEKLVECDHLACGFDLVPNIRLASLLGCEISGGRVVIDRFQRTSIENIFCAGEPTGIGGLESSLIEGRIAGLAAAERFDEAEALLPQRETVRRFSDGLERTFKLKAELKELADDDTIFCRCEDVTYGAVKLHNNWRTAKLQTRCGMGPCQGQICGTAAEFIFGWNTGDVRPPLFPVRVESLAAFPIEERT